MRILTMQAFLVAIDPVMEARSGRHDHFPNTRQRYQIHSLPVKSSFVFDAVSVRELGKVHLLEQWLQVREILMEAGRLV